ncbi:FabD/lysophospholipase-like protein [Venturia nashicola]|nr:FabD/lysophospholipase-like protein [Venturia nashicola]
METVPSPDPSSAQTTPTLENNSTFSRHKRHPSSTTFASLYEDPWDKQCVLSLDGGGIRGYSSLIILRELMEKVKTIETRGLSGRAKEDHSSYDPHTYIPCIHNTEGVNKTTGAQTGHMSCGSSCRYLPAHYFDYVGGTSTGGLISIMLGRLRMSVEDCMREYEKLSDDIFGHPRLASVKGPVPWLRDKYNGETIQKAVEDVISRRMSPEERKAGAGTFNSPPGLCRTAVFAYSSKISNSMSEYSSTRQEKRAVDSEDSAPYIFRSYDHWASSPPAINERNPGFAHNVAIWEAARATTAAPLYFDPIKIGNRKFGDGGFGNNNPAEEMMAEVSSMNGSDMSSIALLVSVGTGEIPISRLEDGILQKYIAYFNAARKLASDAESAHMRLIGWQRNAGLPYHRFNVPLGTGLEKIKLDEWKKTPKWYQRHHESTIETIRKATEEYCARDDIRQHLEEVADILVQHRRSRRTHELWPLVSRGEQYRCTFEKCRMCQQVVPRKEDLEWHLQMKHGLKGGKRMEWFVQQGLCPPKESSKLTRVDGSEGG